MTQAAAIAMEHVLWSAEQGMSPLDVLRAIGEPWEWAFNPTTSYVVSRIERAWERVSVPAKQGLRVVA